MAEEMPAKFICEDCVYFLCVNCCKCHKSNKSSADHYIRNVNETSSKDSRSKLFVNTCFKHKDKKIKLFCSNDDLPCCTMCVSIDHQKCDKVSDILDETKEFCSTKTVLDIQEKLEKYSKDYETLVDFGKVNLVDLENQFQKQRKLIEDKCKELVQRVTEFESNSKSALTKSYNEKRNKIETEIDMYKNFKKS